MIATVYSYKPDVGCTMAAVNIAIALSQESAKRVLLVDWNFAEPKVLLWLKELSESPAGSFIDLLSQYKALIDGELPITADRLPKKENFVNATSIPGLDYLPASVESGIDYRRLTSFDWVGFYRDYHGGAIVEHLREQWAREYDVAIVVSNKGISDAASVCTMQVADVIVLMIPMSTQQLEASDEVARTLCSPELKRNGRPVKILPVLSRVSVVERQHRFEFRERVREAFSKYLPPEIEGSAYFDEVQIPDVPYYGYGHEIALLRESDKDRLSMAWVYRALARYLLALANEEKAPERRS